MIIYTELSVGLNFYIDISIFPKKVQPMGLSHGMVSFTKSCEMLYIYFIYILGFIWQI